MRWVAQKPCGTRHLLDPADSCTCWERVAVHLHQLSASSKTTNCPISTLPNQTVSLTPHFTPYPPNIRTAHIITLLQLSKLPRPMRNKTCPTPRYPSQPPIISAKRRQHLRLATLALTLPSCATGTCSRNAASRQRVCRRAAQECRQQMLQERRLRRS
jgi:hypothetical protein